MSRERSKEGEGSRERPKEGERSKLGRVGLDKYSDWVGMKANS